MFVWDGELLLLLREVGVSAAVTSPFHGRRWGRGPPPPVFFRRSHLFFVGPDASFNDLGSLLPPLSLRSAADVQSTPAPRWLAGKEYRARITRKWKEPPPGPEAPTEAEIDNAVVVAAQGKGAMPHQALERQKTADAGKLMTAAPVVEKR